MRSRGQSPLLPFTTNQRVPSKLKPSRSSSLARIFTVLLVGGGAAVGLYSGFQRFGGQVSSNRASRGATSGRGLAAHEEVAQLQGKNAPKLDSKQGTEGAQEQAVAAARIKAEESGGLSADHAAQGTDTVGQVERGSSQPSGLYSFVANDIDGQPVSLSKFRGKVTLVVNVASECGYTASNYAGLQELYSKYKESGLEILAFPCNSFGNQETGSNQAIKTFAREKYGITFPLFQKVEVLGEDAHPIFKFLRENLPSSEGMKDLWQPKWNFSKWLVNKQGMPVKHYDSAFEADKLGQDFAAEALRAA